MFCIVLVILWTIPSDFEWRGESDFRLFVDAYTFQEKPQFRIVFSGLNVFLLCNHILLSRLWITHQWQFLLIYWVKGKFRQVLKNSHLQEWTSLYDLFLDMDKLYLPFTFKSGSNYILLKIMSSSLSLRIVSPQISQASTYSLVVSRV